MLSPNEDIYYTSMCCLPLQPSQSEQDVLVFLAGTDNRLYLYSLSVSDHSLNAVGSLTVNSFISTNSQCFENWITSIRFHYFFQDNQITLWHVITGCEDGRSRIHKIEYGVDIVDNIHSFMLRNRACRVTLESVIEASRMLLSSVEPHPIVFLHNRYYQ